MDFVKSIAQSFQHTVGAISFSTIDHRWLVVAFAVFVVVLIIFTQEKARAITILIGLYTLWFAISFIPNVMTTVEKAIPPKQLGVVKIIFGALPLAALLALKKKKRSSSSTYSPSRRTRRYEY